MVSDSPPERDFDWTTSGIAGAKKYLDRLHHQLQQVRFSGTEPLRRAAFEPTPDEGLISGEDCKQFQKQLHAAIAAVTEDFERFHLNRAVARIRELSNALHEFLQSRPTRGLSLSEDWLIFRASIVQIQLLAPIAPHFCQEGWVNLGGLGLIADASWPRPNPSYLLRDSVNIAVQFNGKLRTTVTMAPDLSAAEVESQVRGDAKVAAQLAGLVLKKTIIIPNRVVNFVH